MRGIVVVRGLAAGALCLFAAWAPGVAEAATPGLVFDGLVGRHSAQVPPGIAAFSFSCPRGFVATSGAVRKGAAGVEQRDSTTGTHQRRWRFSFVNTAADTRSVSVSVMCARVRIPPRVGFLRWTTKTLITGSTPVAPAARARMSAVCPSGYLPLGGGSVSESVRAGSVVGGGLTRERLTLTRRGIELQTTNSTAAPLRGGVGLRCMTATAPVEKGPDRPLRRRRVAITRTVPAGRDGFFSLRCARRSFPVSSGFSFPAGAGLKLLSAPTAGNGSTSWRVRNPGAVPREIDLNALCVPGRIVATRTN